MSQTTSIDPYLAQQKPPPNNLTVDPQYFNVSLTTAIGRFGYVHVDKPYVIPSRDPTKQSRPAYTATLLMAPGTEEKPILVDLHRACVMIVHAKLGATIGRANPQTGQIEQVPSENLFWVDPKQGGLHYPIRQGNDDYMKEPQKFEHRRGLYYINTSMGPKTKAGADQAPLCMDEAGNIVSGERFYPGCYGRMGVKAAWFENSGNRGVTFYLEWVQFARHGERLQTFDRAGAARAAAAAAGAITGDIGTPPAGFQTGFGPNSAASPVPGTGGGGSFGFAAPPQQPATIQGVASTGVATPAAAPQAQQAAPTGMPPMGRPPGV
jgi:Protein of unknown function (DUF2815)